MRLADPRIAGIGKKGADRRSDFLNHKKWVNRGFYNV